MQENIPEGTLGPHRPIPIAAPHPAAAAETAACDAAPQRKAVARRDHPICIVDDDAWVCDSLSAVLDAYGFETLAYGSGAEFLADERRRQLGCLIIDHHMPGMDGLEVLAALHREGVSVPAILITGRLDTGIPERAGKLGVIAVLEKPFAVARLVELIRAGLDGRR
jgi:two-component system, LuxR family, response regulator FixJ